MKIYKINRKCFIFGIMKYDNIVCVDMDGVLVDFVNGFKVLNPEDNLNYFDFIDKYSKSKTWKRINRGGVDFWEHLGWTKNGQKVFNYIRDTFDNIKIIVFSTAAYDPSSEKGKRKWLYRELGIKDVVNKKEDLNKNTEGILSRNKYLWVDSLSEVFNVDKEHIILVDDRESVLTPWLEAGGTGYLYNDDNFSFKKLSI